MNEESKGSAGDADLRCIKGDKEGENKRCDDEEKRNCGYGEPGTK